MSSAAAAIPHLLDGRPTMVVGAGSGIGAGIAGVLAAAGARVHCVDLKPELARGVAEQLVADGLTASWGAADATDADSITTAVDQGVERMDGLAGFVSTVGDTVRHSVLDCTVEEWDRLAAVNSRSAFLATRAALPHLIGAGGSIVLMASRAGTLGTYRSAAYSTTKSAIIGFVRQAAADYGWDGVRINALAPSGVDHTGLFLRNRDPDPVRRRFMAGVPLVRFHHRLISPQDIGLATLFLISDMSTMITGQTLLIDGGQGGWEAGGPPADPAANPPPR